SFGRDNAGKEVTSSEFQAYVQQVAGKSMSDFFDYWLQRPGLPRMRLERAGVTSTDKGFKVDGEIVYEGPSSQTTVEVAVETTQGDESKTFQVKSARTPFALETKNRPLRVIVDKYASTAKANGGIYSVLTWYGELENTLIVFGTADEAATNRE